MYATKQEECMVLKSKSYIIAALSLRHTGVLKVLVLLLYYITITQCISNIRPPRWIVSPWMER